jgi:hypothetical protein
VGVDQIISLGMPNVALPQYVVGIGIDEIVDFGSPNVGITQPQNTVGVGIGQLVDFGSPSILQSQDPTGVGIEQLIDLGAPSIVRSQETVGASIVQLVDLGTPGATLSQDAVSIGIDQAIDLGVPMMSSSIGAQTANGIGIGQLVDVGAPQLDAVIIVAEGIGIQQDVVLGIPSSSASLQLTADQASVFIDLDAALHEAFSNGVQGAVDPTLIAEIEGYATDLTTLQQYQTRLIFEELAAATMTALNIPGILPTTSSTATTNIARVTPGGTSGTLTFVDGILTSKVEPT